MLNAILVPTDQPKTFHSSCVHHQSFTFLYISLDYCGLNQNIYLVADSELCKFLLLNFLGISISCKIFAWTSMDGTPNLFEKFDRFSFILKHICLQFNLYRRKNKITLYKEYVIGNNVSIMCLNFSLNAKTTKDIWFFNVRNSCDPIESNLFRAT